MKEKKKGKDQRILAPFTRFLAAPYHRGAGGNRLSNIPSQASILGHEAPTPVRADADIAQAALFLILRLQAFFI